MQKKKKWYVQDSSGEQNALNDAYCLNLSWERPLCHSSLLPAGGEPYPWGATPHQAAGGGQRHGWLAPQPWPGLHRGPGHWDGDPLPAPLTGAHPFHLSLAERELTPDTQTQPHTLISPPCCRVTHKHDHTRQGQEILSDIKYRHRHRGKAGHQHIR